MTKSVDIFYFVMFGYFWVYISLSSFCCIGLQDLDNPYNILSAAVGCQEQQFPDDKREQVKQLLISIVDDYIGPIANRRVDNTLLFVLIILNSFYDL